MIWSNLPPTVPGWYFRRTLLSFRQMVWEPVEVIYLKGQDRPRVVTQWAGPIPEPKES